MKKIIAVWFTRVSSVPRTICGTIMEYNASSVVAVIAKVKRTYQR